MRDKENTDEGVVETSSKKNKKKTQEVCVTMCTKGCKLLSVTAKFIIIPFVEVGISV